ncbi:MAG: hypothetical protein HC819_24985 [Cyclobacteriaceae bacterium]|nr:hypothetical protein [Cyclobacteriaceae bacterium]
MAGEIEENTIPTVPIINPSELSTKPASTGGYRITSTQRYSDYGIAKMTDLDKGEKG